MSKPVAKTKLITRDKSVRHNYHIHESFQAGMVLLGSEVKSLRLGQASLRGGYVIFKEGQLFMTGLHISEYEYATQQSHAAERDRKLLLSKREIKKICETIQKKGYTCVPQSIYFAHGYAKCDIALVSGKKDYDKREDIKKRDIQRTLRREVKLKS